MAKDTDKLLTLAKERFKRALDYENDNRENALDDLKFSEGEQWPDKVKTDRENDGQPCLVMNRVPSYIRQIVNDARQVRPAIKTRGVDSETDPESAEVLNGMIRAIEQASAAESAYDWAFEYAVRAGFGYWRVVTDYADDESFEQEIRIERVRNPFAVYLDPAAERQDGSDAMWGFVVEKLSKDQFETRYPGKQGGWEQGQRDEWWFGDDWVRIAEYWEVVETPTTIRLIENPLTGEQVTVEGDIDLPEGALVVAERKAKKRQVVQRLISSAEVLEETLDYPGKYIPIVRVLGREIDIEGEVTYKGLTRDIKDPQRNYNYWRSAMTERVALAPKAPWVGPKGAFKNPKWRQANIKNYAYLEYDGEVMPTRTQPPDVSPGFVAEVQTAAEEMKAITGIYDASIGARSNEVSGIAINKRRSESDVSNFDFIDNLSKAMTYCGRILVDLIPKVYSGPRMVRILRPDGTDDNVMINQPYVDPKTQKDRHFKIENGKYDVVVDVGPSYATQREEAAESMIEVLKAFPNAAPLIGDLVAKNLDWPEADEFAKRLRMMLPSEILSGENPAIKSVLAQKDQEMQTIGSQLQAAMHQISQLQIELQKQQQKFEIDKRELARKISKDMQDYMVKMTDLELQAGRDLAPQGLAY